MIRRVGVLSQKRIRNMRVCMGSLGVLLGALKIWKRLSIGCSESRCNRTLPTGIPADTRTRFKTAYEMPASSAICFKRVSHCPIVCPFGHETCQQLFPCLPATLRPSSRAFDRHGVGFCISLSAWMCVVGRMASGEEKASKTMLVMVRSQVMRCIVLPSMIHRLGMPVSMLKLLSVDL